MHYIANNMLSPLTHLHYGNPESLVQHLYQLTSDIHLQPPNRPYLKPLLRFVPSACYKWWNNHRALAEQVTLKIFQQPWGWDMATLWPKEANLEASDWDSYTYGPQTMAIKLGDSTKNSNRPHASSTYKEHVMLNHGKQSFLSLKGTGDVLCWIQRLYHQGKGFFL